MLAMTKNQRRRVQLREENDGNDVVFSLTVKRWQQLHAVGRRYSRALAATAPYDVRAEELRELVHDWRRYRRTLTTERGAP